MVAQGAAPGERILVLGAGELGMPMLRALSRNAYRDGNTTVSVMLRPATTLGSEDAAKRRDIAEIHDLGVSVHPGDVVHQSIAELAAIFARFDTVISCVGFTAGTGTQMKLTHAVLDAGVKRYVPWQFGVDYDVIGRGSPQTLFDEQLDVRDLLRSQHRTEWIIVSTGMFTSFLFEPAFGVVDLPRRTLHGLGSWDNAVTVTTPDDIGALTARIMCATPAIANQVVHLAGDTVTYRRLADLVDDMLAIKVDRVLWTVPALLDELARAPDDPMKKYRVVFAQGNGVAWDVHGTFNGERGIATTTVEQWARANLNSPPSSGNHTT